ncbi:hypothetical protein Smar_0656 [Staphylothermus marinus F1]|uniref:Uncharacterized protein n=1 Tax=Staphylothermus marinus (strain ATCC 43588 / DSM 3639 / JCM 9404 / F1) TaxID=399550 RepID=A3DMA2_STAMF|nr:hypothetical protein [Staphylothermus marinus]ABN69762.1 hypothetical protein Smar_0656 [Staphylothermus marinus F1]
MNELDIYMATLLVTGLAVLNGTVVYLIFYRLLGKIFWEKLRSPSRLKEEVVMCGQEYLEETLSAPVSRVFTDIVKRSLPKLSRIIEEGGGTSILNNWFAWMLVLLLIIIVLAYVYG